MGPDIRRANHQARDIAKSVPTTSSASERHRAARIGAKASATGCCAITVQSTLAVLAEVAIAGLPSASRVTTAAPLAAATAAFNDPKPSEAAWPRSTWLISG